MNGRPKDPNAARRAERLRAALRENLKRRKAQARGRETKRESAENPHDSAGIVQDKPES